MSQPAPGALEAVRAFVNTVNLEDEQEQLTDPRALGTWLRERELLDGGGRAPTVADLRRAVDLREALRELLLGHHGDHEPASGAAETVDAAARRARLEMRFDERGTATLAPAAAGVDGALGRLLSIVAAAQADGSWERLKACPWDTCRWAFYDHSKNRSGRWCSMEVCGNRAKVAAYRRRAAASSVASPGSVHAYQATQVRSASRTASRGTGASSSAGGGPTSGRACSRACARSRTNQKSSASGVVVPSAAPVLRLSSTVSPGP